jgi:hypothetical protein
VKEHAVDLVRQHGEADSSGAQGDHADAAAHHSMGSRIRDRVQTSVHDLLAHGLDELLHEIRG